MSIARWLLVAFFTALTLLGFAGAARRLLQVRFGIWRTLLAGAVAFLLAGPVFGALTDQAETEGNGVLLLFLFVGIAGSVMLAMIFLVLAEALVPSGMIPPLREWPGAIRRGVERSRRYWAISRIFVGHGLRRALRARRRDADEEELRHIGSELRAAFEEAGVTFVKLGQVLSTRRDLLPVEIVDELARLQDNAAPAPWPDIVAVLQSELQTPLDEIFTTLDATPLASASIAQVHTGRLRSGAEVVVKVQRPAIGPLVERDLDIVVRLARRLDASTTWGRTVGVVELAHGFGVALRDELDFRIEVANMTAVRRGVEGRSSPVVVPRPVGELCTRRVMVMDRLEGAPLRTATAALDADRRRALAEALLGEVLGEIVVDGVFHADPHPGNVLILDDDHIGLLDFGSVARLASPMRDAVRALLFAIEGDDPAGVTDALLDVVARSDDLDEQALERAVGRLMARHLRGGPVGMAMFVDLVRVVTSFGLAVPPEIAGMFRALATIEGTLAVLDPSLDIVDASRRFAADNATVRAAVASAHDVLERELLAILPMMRRLPRRLDRIGRALEQDRFSVNVRPFTHARDRRRAADALHQLEATVLAATAGIMAALLLGTTGGPEVTPDVTLYQLLGYLLLIVSAVLALRVLAVIFRRE